MAAACELPEFLDEMRFWHKLRMKLVPYLSKTARECVEKSRPMMRPLVYDWPEDRYAVGCDDEFMLGDDLLAAPLLEENRETRQVYLPRGEWIGLFDRKCYAGGQIVTAGGGGRLPVFVRPGSALLKINLAE